MSNHFSIHPGAVSHRTARLGTTLSGLVLVLLGQACGARYEIGELEPPLSEVEPPLGEDSTGGDGLVAVLVVDGLDDADALLGGSNNGILLLGDVDGDGFEDWMVSGQLVYGAPRPAEGLTLSSEKGPNFSLSGVGTIGLRTVGAGDFNGDGYSDVLVRDPLGTNFVEVLPPEPSPEDFEARKEREAEYFRTVSQLQAFLWYGGPERSYGEHVLNDEAVGFRITEDLTSRFRSVLAQSGDDIDRGGTYEVRPEAIGDIDGDGYGDLAVTATVSWSTSRINPGVMFGLEELDRGRETMTYVYYGRPERFELAAPHEPDARFAGLNSLRAFGDVNGDGYADILAATPQGWHLIGGSAARLRAQPALDAVGVPLLGSTDEYGATPLGDIDGDGCDDFSFMIYGDAGRPNHLVYGSASLLQGPLDRSASSAEIVASAEEIAGVGDWDGDGKFDLIIAQATSTGDRDHIGVSVIAGTSKRYAGRYEIPPLVPQFQVAADPSLPPEGTVELFFGGGDADGDGRGDLFFGSYPPGDRIMRSYVKYGGPLTPTIH